MTNHHSNVPPWVPEDPPPPARIKPKWGPILAPLREQPGVWVRLEGLHSPSLASRINRGDIAGIESGEFEATTRQSNDPWSPKGRLTWVRFVGDS